VINLEGKIFIGVDGGGTTTKAVAITGEGKVLGKAVGEGTNFYAANMSEARNNLQQTIAKLIEECKISDYEFISIGMSSLDDEPTEEIVKTFAGEIFLPEKIEMQSDVYMALMGMTLGKPGIMVVSGTGSMAIAIDQEGELHVLGGWGYLLHDEGSAYHIAIEGIKAGIRSFEGMGDKTILEKRVINFFNVKDHRELIDIFYNPPMQNSKVAKFAKEVEKCANEGDSAAASIVNNAVNVLVKYACNLMEILHTGTYNTNDCIIGMYGGVFQNSPYITNSFIQGVHDIYPNAKIGFPGLAPEVGAVLYGMKKRGYPVTREFLNNLKGVEVLGSVGMSRSVEVTESVGMSRSVDVKLTESTEVSCRISEPALGCQTPVLDCRTQELQELDYRVQELDYQAHALDSQTFALNYIANIEELIEEVKETQMQALKESARIISECLISKGMIYIFGTGHSHMLAEEIFYRAGGLARVNPILDEGLMLHSGAVKSTSMERLHGYAKALLDNYPIQKDDVIIIASNSGRNTVCIEMAIEAKKMGMKILALTNLKHSKSVTSRHESGRLLYELADIVIDNCGSIGDASVKFEHIGSVGPTSTVMGAILLHAIICDAIGIMLEKNVIPEVFCSSNVDGGDSINQSLIDKYTKEIKSL
jgi:uncharacterized phosphosugar-binding protein/N-acetylglucosamine kinase-like BadF-type ATPase